MIIIKSCIGATMIDDKTEIEFVIELPDSFYADYNVDEKEYPKDAWSLICLQEPEDRENGVLWFDLYNKGLERDFVLDVDERELVLRYIKENNLDIEYDLKIK